jgi:hypothetical protein
MPRLIQQGRRDVGGGRGEEEIIDGMDRWDG